MPMRWECLVGLHVLITLMADGLSQWVLVGLLEETPWSTNFSGHCCLAARFRFVVVPLLKRARRNG